VGKQHDILLEQNQELSESNARFRALIDGLPDAMFIIDTTTGIVLDVNPAASRLLGMTREELIGLHQVALHPPQLAQRSQEYFRYHAGQDGAISLEHVVLRSDGTVVPVEICARKIPLQGSEVLAAIFRDITSRRRADAEIRRLSSFPRLNPKPLVEIGIDGRVLFCNAAASAAIEEAGAPSPTAFLPADIAESLNARADTHNAQWQREVTIGNRIFEETITYLPEFRSVRIYADDISERKQAEQDLREYADRLETANQLLQSSNAAAQAATRAKSEFLANVSHEIRTPMTAILGFTDLLMENVERPENIDALRTIQRNGRYLLGILNDILCLSKIEAGRLDVERIRCSPAHVLADVVSLMRVRADAKRLPLTVEAATPIPQTVLCDPARLRQILLNLVGNAVKFTEHGEIRIVMRLLNADAAEPRLQFDVIDTGIGMSGEAAARLFRPFMQADASTSRRFGGTGLGLTISKRLAEMLGGDIAVASTPGKGSTFSVWVATGPLDGVPQERCGEKGTGGEAMWDRAATDDSAGAPVVNSSVTAARFDRQCRVLLAEDGPDNQRLIRLLLEKAGAEVVVVQNGREAVELVLHEPSEDAAAAVEPFDVILMDIQMPEMDGYEATRRLRAAGYAGPIIALTAHAMREDIERCLAAGCNEHAAKPIDRKQLLSLVAKYLMVAQ
jgi:PAS domain S-box-containing protein